MTGRISKVGDHGVRVALYEAANVILTRPVKGAALKSGYEAARARGFTHVVQLDADGQHNANDVPRFVAAMRAHPDALVLGVPEFDASDMAFLRITPKVISVLDYTKGFGHTQLVTP